MKELRFYKVNNQYGFLSNFAPYPIFIDGIIWKTLEHYFQASKFEHLQFKVKINELESALEAARMGRNPKNIIRSDWDSIKDLIMYNGLNAKFLQHPKLRVELLNTMDYILIEETPNDKYWGNGGDGSGENMLGKLLMKVRGQIREISSEINLILPPWIAFPTISQFDTFWRMGLGENYLTYWAKYYLALEDKKKYEKMFPPNINWVGIYQ